MIPQVNQVQVPINQNNIPNDQSSIDKDAFNIVNLMKKDKDKFIYMIANRKHSERLEIVESYKKQFNKDLMKEFKKELSGDFRDTVLALFQDHLTFDCNSLNKAMKGLGTNEDTLIEILSTRSNWYIGKLKERYKQLFGKELAQELSSELSGDLKNVILSMVSGSRSENKNPSQEICAAKAEQLYNAGEKKLGTDKKIFYKILTEDSTEELKLIDNEYEKKYNHGLLIAIEKEFSGKMRKLLETILASRINISEYYAYRIFYAVDGPGTKDSLLIRVVVLRNEKDIGKIMEGYRRMFKRDMLKDIIGDTSGHYQKLLVALCKHY